MYQKCISHPDEITNMLFQETKNLFFHILAVYVRTGENLERYHMKNNVAENNY